MFIGTVRSFLFYKDDTYVELAPNHTLSNSYEEERVRNTGGITNKEHLSHDFEFIDYTRCLGDFKTKLYFNELEQFRLVN